MEDLGKLCLAVLTWLGVATLTCALSLGVLFGCAALSEEASLNIFTRPTYQLVVWTLVTLCVVVIAWAILEEELAGIGLGILAVVMVIDIVKTHKVMPGMFSGTTVTTIASQIIYSVLALLWCGIVGFVFNRRHH